MFFYSESEVPKIIANRSVNNINLRFPQALNLLDAQEGDLLVVYAFREGGFHYGVQSSILSSSTSSNWYNLPETKTATLQLGYVGGMIQSVRGCDGNSMGTIVANLFTEERIVMKRLTTQDLSGQVTLRCYEGANISYLIIRNVKSYDIHRNSSGNQYTQDFSGDIYSPTATSNWQTANTNITASTKKLFIMGETAAGVVSFNAGTNISTAGKILREINLSDLTGPITISLNRGGRAYSFLYNSNTVYAPWAAFMAFIVS